MMTYYSKYPLISRLVIFIAFVVTAAPFITALADTDGCCNELTCCDYLSCQCNCHAVAGLVSIQDNSLPVGGFSLFVIPSPNTPAKDFSEQTDRPPRFLS